MKIFLFTPDFLPHSIGGTEIYVFGLAKELRGLGHNPLIGIADSGHRKDYCYEGIPVHVIKAKTSCVGTGASKLDACTGDVEQRWKSSSSFAPSRKLRDFLEGTQPDIIHSHPVYITSAVPLMEMAKKLNIPTLCTYHAPAVTCGRGDMMRWDITCCDGVTALNKCTSCVLHQKGIFKWAACALAKLMNSTPLRHATPRPQKWLLRKIHTMLSIPSQRASHLEEWRNTAEVIDHWVAPAIWVQEVLKSNGVNSDRIMISRQGLVQNTLDFTKNTDQNPEIATQDNYHFKEFSRNRYSTPLRLGYLGRIHHHKGVHVLVDAMGCLREFPNISLKIAGEAVHLEKRYEDRLRIISQKDPRIHWQGAVRPEDVGYFLRTLDLLVVPSIWMETGPLTVLEAWAAGVPVLGSNLGGIAEWINEYGGGWLFEPGRVAGMADAIKKLIKDPLLLNSVEIPARVRNMTDVAREMVDLYDALLTKRVNGNTRCQASLI